MKIDLVPGKFYESKDGRIWCCFRIDAAEMAYRQASCVRVTDGTVAYFQRNGKHDSDDEKTLVELLPYWGADGDAREQFKQACEDAAKQVRAELRKEFDKLRRLTDKVRELITELDRDDDD